MNLKKILPVILLVLVLAFLFLPRTNTAAPTQTPQSTQALTLITASPTKSPTPAPTGTPAATAKPTASSKPTATPRPTGKVLDENGTYTTKEDLALYIHTYGHLPENFIKKKEAEALGWNGSNLHRVLPGMCIGGDYFGNYEGILPKAKGRRWTECDVDTLGARSRGEKRIVFSNDGLIYYTEDHYESFELLYDGW